MIKVAVPHNRILGRASVIDQLRALNRTQLHAVLATDFEGRPYTSLVAFALSGDEKGLVFATPKDTTKYRNLLKNNNVSLLIDNRNNSSDDYLRAEAVTVIGKAKTIRRGNRRDELINVLTGKHSSLRKYLQAPSTALVYVEIMKLIHVGRFQTITELSISQKH